MLLVIDVGNTNTIFAIYKNDIIFGSWRCSTSTNRTAEEYFVWLKELMKLKNLKTSDINSCVICSVVPQVVFNLKLLSKKYFDSSTLIVGEKDCLLPIEIRVDKGTFVGADRLVNTVGAFNKFGGNLIVVDFGTATTFDVVDKDGAYIGGVIAPGVEQSVKALHESAAALPYINISIPKKVVGTNTIECMRSGVFWGYSGLVEGIIKKISEEQNRNFLIIATGGLSTLFAKQCKFFNNIDLEITLLGLSIIHKFNQKEDIYEN